MPNKSAKRRYATNDWLLKTSLLLPMVCAPVLAQEADADAAADVDETTETVIVTGTRATGVDAFTSSSPIQVLSSDSLEAAGRPDLMNALANVVPSFTAQAFGGDMANQTLQRNCADCRPTTRWYS